MKPSRRIRRTLWGEAIESRPAGAREPRPVTFYATRDVYCPTCHARPHQDCQESTEAAIDRERLTIAARRMGKLGPTEAFRFHGHEARSQRAASLTQIAKGGIAALARLAVDAKAHQEERRRTMIDPSTLPLFRGTP